MVICENFRYKHLSNREKPEKSLADFCHADVLPLTTGNRQVSPMNTARYGRQKPLSVDFGPSGDGTYSPRKMTLRKIRPTGSTSVRAIPSAKESRVASATSRLGRST